MNPESKSQIESTESKNQAYTPERLWQVLSQWKSENLDSKVLNEEMDEEKLKQLHDSETRKFIEKLVSEKDRFKNIFETVRGSVYFVLLSGESLRIKCSNGKFDGYSAQPILKEIFFVSGSEQERILKIFKESGRHVDGILGVPLETTGLTEGSYPIELNMYHSNSKYDASLIRLGNTVKIIAPKFEWTDRDNYYEEDAQGQISNGIHVGHEVSKIIK